MPDVLSFCVKIPASAYLTDANQPNCKGLKMHTIESYKTYEHGIFAMIIAPDGHAYEMTFTDLAEAQSYVSAMNAFVKSNSKA